MKRERWTGRMSEIYRASCSLQIGSFRLSPLAMKATCLLWRPHALAKLLAGTAHVVHLTGRASRELSNTLGDEWSVYQGAIRCYNPQLQWTDDKYRHRLWLPKDIRRADARSRNGLIDACALHIFALVTARFESWTLLTPSAVRRRLGAAERTEVVHQSSTAFELVSPDAAIQLALDAPSS